MVATRPRDRTAHSSPEICKVSVSDPWFAPDRLAPVPHRRAAPAQLEAGHEGLIVYDDASSGARVWLVGRLLDDGTLYTVVDDWEHDTETPQTPGGIFLYEAAHRWFDAYVWNTVLTPNYNTAHDDHLHVDLTPAAHFLQLWSGRYFGPAPYAD